MKKYDYLKLAIQNRSHEKLSWLISLLSTIGKVPVDTLEYLDLTNEPTGYHYYDGTELVRIEDTTTPLFTVSDIVEVDSSWLPIIKKPIETTVGRLIANAVCIDKPFRGNIEYINKKFTSKNIDDIVAPILTTNVEDRTKHVKETIYVEDYLAYIDSTQYLNSLSGIVVVSASPKVMVKPEGLDTFVSGLISKYKDKLHDPVELSNFEDELKAFDDKFLKDEASYGLFISGKVKDVARKKLFLTIGAGLSFDNKTKLEPILTSLAQGWNLNPTDFKNMVDDIRYGSYSRGSETVKGGVTFKTLIRATNGIVISDTDCGSKTTLTRTYEDADIDKLVGRYILVNDRVVDIHTVDIAKQYANKSVKLRTTAYCISANNTYCKVCTGHRIADNKNALALLLSNLSDIILNASLKLFHGTVLTTAKVNIDKHIT